MSWVRNLAALVALAAIAFAVGDWASHPNAAGAVGIMLLIALFAVLLSFLFRPEGETRAAQLPDEPPEPRRRRRGLGAAVAGWGAEEAAEARTRRSGRRAPAGGQVDINHAGVDELAALPAVGPVAAGRIVSEREANGPFSTVSDLARVPGLHPAKVRALAGRARV